MHNIQSFNSQRKPIYRRFCTAPHQLVRQCHLLLPRLQAQIKRAERSAGAQQLSGPFLLREHSLAEQMLELKQQAVLSASQERPAAHRIDTVNRVLRGRRFLVSDVRKEWTHLQLETASSGSHHSDRAVPIPRSKRALGNFTYKSRNCTVVLLCTTLAATHWHGSEQVNRHRHTVSHSQSRLQSRLQSMSSRWVLPQLQNQAVLASGAAAGCIRGCFIRKTRLERGLFSCIYFILFLH